jgi:hypothetical protein
MSRGGAEVYRSAFTISVASLGISAVGFSDQSEIEPLPRHLLRETYEHIFFDSTKYINMGIGPFFEKNSYGLPIHLHDLE